MAWVPTALMTRKETKITMPTLTKSTSIIQYITHDRIFSENQNAEKKNPKKKQNLMKKKSKDN